MLHIQRHIVEAFSDDSCLLSTERHAVEAFIADFSFLTIRYMAASRLILQRETFDIKTAQGTKKETGIPESLQFLIF